VGDEDAVVQEQLSDHQRATEDRTARVLPKEHPDQSRIPDARGRNDVQLIGWVDRWERLAKRRTSRSIAVM
jgi:hypothetical protein